MYRFAPYIIHLKKHNLQSKFIVYTRPSRFDLYGKFADILVPFNLRNEKNYKQNKFKLDGLRLKDYTTIKDYYYKKYSSRYDIVDHIFPDIFVWRNRIKWQFPRSKMDYDFQPRQKNIDTIDFLMDSDTTNSVFVSTKDSDICRSLSMRGYNTLMYHWLIDIVKDTNNNLNVSFIGCLISFLRTCKFVVGNINSTVCKLALLLNIPVISIDEPMDYDSIHLLNPLNTPVINCYNIEEGVDIYEDNF